MKKMIVAWFIASLGFLCAGDLDENIAVRATNGEKVEIFRFENFPGLKVVCHTIRKMPGVHYFVNDCEKKDGDKLYRMHSCTCCLAYKKVMRHGKDVEETLSTSDLMLIHKIGNPTGQMLHAPWEHDLYPLPGKSSDYTGNHWELLLASL